MMMRRAYGWATAAAVCAGLIGGAARAQEGLIPHAQDKPPGPALSPAEAVAKMTVPEGFRVEVVASEPDLVNPVSMTFDERGRIWVTESLEYPRQSAGPGRDRVKVLEDTDGDGKVDKTWIFADGLNIPSGIAVGHSGVWVANSPDILFYPDADRDGKPDGKPQVVVTGFGRDDTHELPNSLTWGPDGRLYGWNGVFNRSVVKQGDRTFDFTCAIFRIDPVTREFDLFCEGTSNPWGIAINERGDFFASACVIDHLWHLTETGYYIRQGGPYPEFTWPIGSIVDHKHQKAAYCGIHWFDSAAYPPEYRGKLFMGNIHGNCVNSDTLEENGSTYRCKSQGDFLSANDAWFMPVVQKTGPDGCLYVLDWYDRYHCYQDANRDPAGIDRLKGRLYRVRYKDAPRRAGFDLAKDSDDRLIERLGDANIYDRDITQRLLTERLRMSQDHGLRAKLEKAVHPTEGKPSPHAAKASMHALWVLAGSKAVTPAFLGKLLTSDSPIERAWGVRIAGNLGRVVPENRELVRKLAADPDPDVRAQVVAASRKIEGIDPIELLEEALAHSSDDPLIPQLVWQNLHPLLGSRAEALFAGNEKWSPGLAALMPRVADRLLGSREPSADAVEVVLRALADGPNADEGLARRVLETIATKLENGELTGARSDALRREIKPVLDELTKRKGPLAQDASLVLAAWKDPDALAMARAMIGASSVAGEPQRLRAFEAVVASGDAKSALDAAERVLASSRGGSIEFRGRVIGSLGRLDDPKVAELLIRLYPALDNDLKGRAIERLTERPAWAKTLLAAVADKRIAAGAINMNQVRRLQSIRDPETAKAVRTLWGTVREERNPQRELVIGQMRNFLHKTPGDPVAGRKAYEKLCAQCHKIHGQGQEVGPDITSNGRNDFEQLLSNVFDPNLVIGEAYQAVTVATKDGRVLSGLLVEDNPQRLVLKIQGGKNEVVPIEDLEERKLTKVSLMPEDVEKQFTPQEIADLFAFLCLDKPPEDPSARRLPGAPAEAGRSGGGK